MLDIGFLYFCTDNTVHSEVSNFRKLKFLESPNINPWKIQIFICHNEVLLCKAYPKT